MRCSCSTFNGCFQSQELDISDNELREDVLQ